MVALLPVDGDVGLLALVGLDELLGLDKEAAGAAAGVVDAAAGGFDHLDQRLDDGFWRVVFACALALGGGELADAVFVDAADQVEIGAGALELDVGEEVDQPGEHGLVEALLAEDLGQRALQALVLGLDVAHRLVELDTYFGRLGIGSDMRPAGAFRDPEDALGQVDVAVLGVLVGIFGQFGMEPLEGDGDVAEE